MKIQITVKDFVFDPTGGHSAVCTLSAGGNADGKTELRLPVIPMAEGQFLLHDRLTSITYGDVLILEDAGRDCETGGIPMFHAGTGGTLRLTVGKDRLEGDALNRVLVVLNEDGDVRCALGRALAPNRNL